MKLFYLLVFILLGGIIGALMGYYGKCNSGACPLTANPFRGAVWGAFLGILLGLSFLQSGQVAQAADAQNMVEIKDAKDFDAKIAANKVVIADFYAKWCPPCKMLGPVLEKLSGQYNKKALFIKVDIDNNKELSSRFKIESIPCVIFFKDSKEVSRLVGLRNDTEYKENIEALLK